MKSSFSRYNTSGYPQYRKTKNGRLNCRLLDRKEAPIRRVIIVLGISRPRLYAISIRQRKANATWAKLYARKFPTCRHLIISFLSNGINTYQRLYNIFSSTLSPLNSFRYTRVHTKGRRKNDSIARVLSRSTSVRQLRNYTLPTIERIVDRDLANTSNAVRRYKITQFHDSAIPDFTYRLQRDSPTMISRGNRLVSMVFSPNRPRTMASICTDSNFTVMENVYFCIKIKKREISLRVKFSMTLFAEFYDSNKISA